MDKHKDLQKKLQEAQKRADKAEGKIDDLAVAAELIEDENSSKFAFKHDVVEPTLVGLDLTELVKAVAEADVDALLTAHSNLRTNALAVARWLDSLLDHEDEQDSKTDGTTDSGSDDVELIINNRLEDRLRYLVHELYEQALTLPREMRLLYRKFSKERDVFQIKTRERDDLIDSLLTDKKVDAQLGVLLARVKRTYPTMDTDDISCLDQLLAEIRKTELKLDCIEHDINQINESIQNQRCYYQELANQVTNLRAKADEIEGLAVMFGIPCPTEIAKQIDETRARLLTLGGEDQTERLKSMMRFYSEMPVRSKSLQKLFANRVEAAALVLTVNSNPRALFSDIVNIQTAISRLFILISLSVKEDKGLGSATMLKIMHLSNLIPDSYHGILEGILELLKEEFFTVEKYKRGYIWKPTDKCRYESKTIVSFVKDPEVLTFALKRSHKLYWDEWREKKYGKKDQSAL